MKAERRGERVSQDSLIEKGGAVYMRDGVCCIDFVGARRRSSVVSIRR
jgi:hypothetical protein